jgi:hypothetical protein
MNANTVNLASATVSTEALRLYFGTSTFTRAQAKRINLHHALYDALAIGGVVEVRANVYRMA